MPALTSKKSRVSSRGTSRSPHEIGSSGVKAKCRLVARQPGLGEVREDLGEGVHATLVGSYVVFYRVIGGNLERSRIVRGDRDIRSV